MVRLEDWCMPILLKESDTISVCFLTMWGVQLYSSILEVDMQLHMQHLEMLCEALGYVETDKSLDDYLTKSA